MMFWTMTCCSHAGIYWELTLRSTLHYASEYRRLLNHTSPSNIFGFVFTAGRFKFYDMFVLHLCRDMLRKSPWLSLNTPYILILCLPGIYIICVYLSLHCQCVSCFSCTHIFLINASKEAPHYSQTEKKRTERGDKR